MLLKIGQLARRTGLTVRALHHYDAIGLLHPSARSGAGYRLYNQDDVSRLYRIQALRRLDLSLAEIARLLEGDSADLQSVIEQQIAVLDRQQVRTAVLRDRLATLLARVRANAEPALPDWLGTLELMAVHDKYFTADELNAMRLLRHKLERGDAAGGRALVQEIRALMQRGVPPESEPAQALAAAWRELVRRSMGGDARLIFKLDTMQRQEPVAQSQTGVDGALIDYMSAAATARRLRVYEKYLSPAEMARLRADAGRRPRAWLALFAALRDCIEQGCAADSPATQQLCRHWLALAREEWGDDAELQRKIQAVHAAEPEMLSGIGMTPEMSAYLDRGIACLQANVGAESCSDSG